MRSRMWPEIVLGTSEPQFPTNAASQPDTSVCDQPVTSDPVPLVPFISEQNSQLEKPSHKPESPIENFLSFQPLEKVETQKDDCDVSRSGVSSLYPPECQLLQMKLVENQVIQDKLTNKSRSVVNGQNDERLPIVDNFKDDTITIREESPQEELNKTNSDQHCLREMICVASSDSPRQSTVNRINCATQTPGTPVIGRKHKTEEELECERLSEDYINYCDDAVLRNLLVPTPNYKTISDYMEGLFNLELERGGRPVRRCHSVRADAVKLVSNYTTSVKSESRQGAVLPLTSAYYTTSESKAKFLTRYSQDIHQQNCASDTELSSKKEELIASIDKKLELLRLEQVVIREEMAQNEDLGKVVTSRVEQLAKPKELEKYRLHVEELEKIINLLLSLSGRLARAQNALVCLRPDVEEEEKKALQAKCDKLSEQHEEARRLKESIDKRSHQVSTFLHRYLSSEEYADYDHFIKMKSKLVMDAREIDEKVKLGEEQLAALRNNANFQIWKQVLTKAKINART
ncbi:protein Shroom2-like [Limulus polyphemus]|uniref:Protein Shroom2-like n=1 Tax=Limulus polyphemus TaxID=6850 RepID=A0ABM1TKP3_LIMPO|nr:protein Shroom2-like [Limulus polyphemus]